MTSATVRTAGLTIARRTRVRRRRLNACTQLVATLALVLSIAAILTALSINLARAETLDPTGTILLGPAAEFENGVVLWATVLALVLTAAGIAMTLIRAAQQILYGATRP